MVKVTVKTEYGEQTYYMDGYLKSNLDLVGEMIRDDGDCPIFIDGTEGSGKSVIAQQIATYCDPTFNLERIVFTPSSFMRSIKVAKNFQAIIYDEAFSGLMSSQALNWQSIMIVKMLAEVRQKNLVLIIVCPSFFDSVKYVSIWRTKFLINCYRDKNYKRGFFRFYGHENKKILYVEGKKLYNYFARKPDFYGRFLNYYTVPEAQYRAQKYTALITRKDDVNIRGKLTERQIKMYVIERLVKMDQSELKKGDKTLIQNVLGMNEHSFWNEIRKTREKIKKEGSQTLPSTPPVVSPFGTG